MIKVQELKSSFRYDESTNNLEGTVQKYGIWHLLFLVNYVLRTLALFLSLYLVLKVVDCNAKLRNTLRKY